MAGIKITDLPPTAGAQLTDVFPVDQLPGPVTYKETNAQLLSLFKANGEALTRVDDTNVTLTLGANAPTALFNATSLTLGWSGVLGMNRGGSNANLTASNGGVIYSTATAMAVLGTANRGLLTTDASGIPSIGNNVLVTENLTGVANPGNPVLNMSNSVGMTYPAASFAITVGARLDSLLTTSQTINSGAISVVNGNSVNLTYDGVGTNDLSTFRIVGRSNNVTWSSSNTANSILGNNLTLTYNGTNVGGRTTDILASMLGTVIVNPPSSGTATIETFKGIQGFTQDSSTVSISNATKNITSFLPVTSIAQVLNSGTNNISNITSLKLYDTSCTLNGAGAGSQVNITNFMGLHLQTPTISGTVSITNRYGVKQDDTSATNAFAGLITAPSINFGGGALSAYVPQTTFTPAITCTTPGDLSVAYTVQQGIYQRVGNLVFFSVTVAATLTYTTATGTLSLSGFPVSSNVSNVFSWTVVGGTSYSVPANLTGYTASVASGSSSLSLGYTRTTAGTSVGLPITQFPTGNAMLVRSSGFYFVT